MFGENVSRKSMFKGVLMEKGTNLKLLSVIFFIVVFESIFVSLLWAGVLKTEIIAKGIEVHSTNATVFNTPLAVYNGSVFFVVVQDPPKGTVPNGYNLQTVVCKASKTQNQWDIESTVVEPRTIDDKWHTQASIGIDPEGYIHVAYNMHNLPWQYAVSKKPGDISSFEFKGQSISIDEIRRAKIANETTFSTVGEGKIPGNQITYPAFYNDKLGNLYITYRYKLKPARKWEERASAGGVAKYNHKVKQWESIGGPIAISKTDAIFTNGSEIYTQYPFVYSEQVDPYLIQLSFDTNNDIHASWLWRKGGAGPDCSNPSYVKIQENMKLPITYSDSCSHIDESDQRYYAPSSLAVDQLDIPWIILNPIGKPRELLQLGEHKKENTPWGGTKIIINDNGFLWVFASGPQIFCRKYGELKWQSIYQGAGSTFVKSYFDRPNSIIMLYMHTDPTHIQIINFFGVCCNFGHLSILDISVED